MSLRDLTSPSLCPGSSSAGPSSLSTLADSLVPSSSKSTFAQTAQPSSSNQLSQAEHALLNNDPRGLGLDLRGGATHRFEQAWQNTPMAPSRVVPSSHPSQSLATDFSHAWTAQNVRGGLADEFARMSMGGLQKSNRTGNVGAMPYRYGMGMNHGYGMSWRSRYSGMMSQRMQMASMVPNAVKEEQKEEHGLKESASWEEGFTSLEGSVAREDVNDVNGEEEFQRVFDLAYREYVGEAIMRREYKFAEREKEQGKSALEALEIGERCREEGRLREAIRWFEEALDRNVDDEFPELERDMQAKAWLLLGKTLAESDEDEMAILGLQNGMKLYEGNVRGERREDHPFLLESLMGLAVSFTNEMDQTKAFVHIKEWFDMWKKLNGIMDSGMKFEGGNEDRYMDATKSGSQRLLDEMKEIAKDRSRVDADFYVMMGVLHNVDREYEEGAEWLKRGVFERPNDASIWNKLGATLSNGGNGDDALRAYRRAVDIDPGLVRAWVNVGTAYSNRQEYKKAIRYYLKSISMTMDNEGQGNGENMSHVWGYIRTNLISMSRGDILELVDRRDLNGLRREF